jgi:hypothetical protein
MIFFRAKECRHTHVDRDVPGRAVGVVLRSHSFILRTRDSIALPRLDVHCGATTAGRERARRLSVRREIGCIALNQVDRDRLESTTLEPKRGS